MKRRLAWSLGAAAALLLLHGVAARRTAFGAASDDALHALLARNLWSGAFAVPAPDSPPASEPLPGFALLMMLPVRLIGTHWELLRLPALLWSVALVGFVRAAALRATRSAAAANAAAVLAALNPVLVGWAGVGVPDVPFAAVCAAALWELGAPKPSAYGLAALAAAGSLLRPEGVALLAVAILLAGRRAKAAERAALGAAALPSALWFLRNRLTTGAFSGYFSNARGLSALNAGRVSALGHAWSLWEKTGGWGILGWPAGTLAATGTALLASVCAFGALRLLDGNESQKNVGRGALGLVAGWALLHLSFFAWQSRYVLSALPAVCALAAAGLAPLFQRRPQAAAVALALALLPALRRDLAFAADGADSPRAALWPNTARWLDAHVADDECVAGLEPYLAALTTSRRVCLLQTAASREDWLAGLRRRDARWILVRASSPRGFTDEAGGRLLAEFDAWAVAAPPLQPAFRDDAEGAVVLRLGAR